jgi:hypothetical protein
MMNALLLMTVMIVTGQKYVEFGEADALEFLESRDYSCVKLEEFADRQSGLFEFDIYKIGTSTNMMGFAAVLLMACIYRIVSLRKQLSQDG